MGHLGTQAVKRLSPALVVIPGSWDGAPLGFPVQLGSVSPSPSAPPRGCVLSHLHVLSLSKNIYFF